jgi:hypothetical protein
VGVVFFFLQNLGVELRTSCIQSHVHKGAKIIVLWKNLCVVDEALSCGTISAPAIIPAHGAYYYVPSLWAYRFLARLHDVARLLD